jgi:phospholipid transport system substrate-binding protein
VTKSKTIGRTFEVARRALAGGVLALALIVPASAESIPPDQAQAGARAAVDETVSKVLAVLRDRDTSQAQKREKIEALAYGRFDFDTISKLVLARNWSKLGETQRADFVKEFKRHLSLTYGSAIDEYKDETVEIMGTRVEGNGDVTVQSELRGARAEPFLVDYRLRAKGSEWYVIDVIIERVSLIQNFRSQTQEIISKDGADGLIAALRAKNAAREAANAKADAS